jgi:hypothetical protein
MQVTPRCGFRCGKARILLVNCESERTGCVILLGVFQFAWLPRLGLAIGHIIPLWLPVAASSDAYFTAAHLDTVN